MEGSEVAHRIENISTFFKRGQYIDRFERFWDDAAVWIYRRSVRGRPGERLLDVGSGRGRLAAEADANGVKAVGAEPYWPAPHLNALVVRGLGEQLPFGSGTFDVVVSLSVLPFVRSADSCAREMLRVTRPGGRLIVAVPELASYVYLRRDHYSYLTSERWARELFGRVGGAGIVNVERIGLRYAIPVLRRTLMRLNGGFGQRLLERLYLRDYPAGIADMAVLTLRRE